PGKHSSSPLASSGRLSAAQIARLEELGARGSRLLPLHPCERSMDSGVRALAVDCLPLSAAYRPLDRPSAAPEQPAVVGVCGSTSCSEVMPSARGDRETLT